jgi:hypothetical protein
LELRLLKFSTGRPHPLAEQPVVFIDRKILPLEEWSVEIEIVGDFLILFVSFFDWSGNQDIFFLVRWKTGVTYRVSVSRFTANLSVIANRADTLCPAWVPRKGDLQTFQPPLARHPRDSQLDPKYA